MVRKSISTAASGPTIEASVHEALDRASTTLEGITRFEVGASKVTSLGLESDAKEQLAANDHVTVSQPFDYFDEAALFYWSVLGLAPAADTEFPAPFGLVRGRAVSDPSGRVRIALQRTLLRRGEWAPNVPYPQHVAFATQDILATGRELQDRGAHCSRCRTTTTKTSTSALPSTRG